MVVLIDNEMNIQRRKHDLLFYNQTGKKRVTIIYFSGSKIDMSILENQRAADDTREYILQYLDSLNKQVSVSR